MAKYTVKFSCGHTEEIQLFGAYKDRTRKIEYFEQHGKCSHCYRESQPHYLVLDSCNGNPYIKVVSNKSYDIKDTLKALGAKWDRAEQVWVFNIPTVEGKADQAWTKDKIQEITQSTGVDFKVQFQGREVKLA